MKLDEQGFPTRPMRPKHWVAWTQANLPPEDWADFYGSQARLWRRSEKRWAAVSIFIALFSMGLIVGWLGVELILLLTGGRA